MRDPTKSPFPGVDPYLEPYWPDVHHRLCTYACDALRSRLPPGLIPRLDERTIIESASDHDRAIIPDVRVIETGRPLQRTSSDSGGLAVAEPLIIDLELVHHTEGYIKVIDPRNDGQIITVIEFASPANKTWTDGRTKYRKKQRDLIQAGVNLVEVDFLRRGEWNSYCPIERIPPSRRKPYHVCVTRAIHFRTAEVYLFDLRDRLTPVAIPLRESDPDVMLDLQALMEQVYLNGSYGYDIDYTRPPEPPLDEADAEWAKVLLA